MGETSRSGVNGSANRGVMTWTVRPWPRTNDETVDMYEETFELHGQRAADAFLSACETEARRRGFVDRRGRRIRAR